MNSQAGMPPTSCRFPFSLVFLFGPVFLYLPYITVTCVLRGTLCTAHVQGSGCQKPPQRWELACCRQAASRGSRPVVLAPGAPDLCGCARRPRGAVETGSKGDRGLSGGDSVPREHWPCLETLSVVETVASWMAPYHAVGRTALEHHRLSPRGLGGSSLGIPSHLCCTAPARLFVGTASPGSRLLR